MSYLNVESRSFHPLYDTASKPDLVPISNSLYRLPSPSRVADCGTVSLQSGSPDTLRPVPQFIPLFLYFTCKFFLVWRTSLLFGLSRYLVLSHCKICPSRLDTHSSTQPSGYSSSACLYHSGLLSFRQLLLCLSLNSLYTYNNPSYLSPSPSLRLVVTLHLNPQDPKENFLLLARHPETLLSLETNLRSW